MFKVYRLTGPAAAVLAIGFLLALLVVLALLLPLALIAVIIALLVALFWWLRRKLAHLFRRKPRPRGLWAA
jgi:hypothetical protein